ncbi:MAG: hypothetical protein CM15mP84_06880 [Cellvibrionales bacterium]|nr:MAG: hypothetical protein CM15mP84_06880 [Cellvibrionales bacterium]
MFLATVNLARHLGIDAEASLRRANTRFEQRFRFMEQSAASEGTDLASESLDELRRGGKSQDPFGSKLTCHHGEACVALGLPDSALKFQ